MISYLLPLLQRYVHEGVRERRDGCAPCIPKARGLGYFSVLVAAFRRLAAGIPFHLFATIAIITLAAPGVMSWRTIVYVSLVGFTIDMLRHAGSPECRTAPARVWYQVKSDLVGHPQSEREFRFWKGVWGAAVLSWIVCAVLLALATSLQRDGNTAARSSFLALLEAANSAVLSIDRRAVAQLRQHAFEAQAEVSSLFFAMNLVFFALFLVITFSGLAYAYTRSLLGAACRRQITLDEKRVDRLLTGALVLLVDISRSYNCGIRCSLTWLLTICNWEGLGAFLFLVEATEQ